MSALGHMGRLMKAGRTLAKHNALIPGELMAEAPPHVRAGLKLAALGSGKPSDHLRPGERLTHALEELGPSFIKLGQFLATRPDVIGPEVAHDLSRLQDRMAPFEKELAVAALEEALGGPLEAVFAEFGAAVAAASIAQVHKARTKEADGTEGKTVAVKVLRPKIEQTFHSEMASFAWAAKRAEAWMPSIRRMRPSQMVGTLRHSVDLELDLRMEAAAASEFADRTRNEDFVRVPEIDWDRTSQRVMTSEWIDGVPLHDRDAVLAAGHDPKKLAAHIAELFLITALRDGFFHADMHQGNVFVDADGKLVLIDFGIMGRLNRDNRRYLAEILYGVVERDYGRVAELHFEAGLVPPHHNVDDFALALRSMGEPIFGKNASAMPMSRVLKRLFEVTEQFDMAAQPELMFLQKTMVVVEGVARDLDPDFNLWEVGRPILRDFVESMIGPEARIRDAAEGFAALGRLLPELPRLVDRMEAQAIAVQRTAPGIVPSNPQDWQAEPRRMGLVLPMAAGAGIAVLLYFLLGA